MKKIQMIMASSHVDLHGDKLTREALQSMASQVKERYLPININHDVRYPPIGRLTSAEVVELPDGESALLGIGELFEESDTPESLVGDGRKIKIRDKDIATISVYYDRTFLDEEGQELISELSKISSEEPTLTLKKALEPIQLLLIAAGVFVLGSIAQGFFKKIGSDLYEKLRDTLIKYYEKKPRSDQIIDFCFSVRQGERVFEVNVLVDKPSDTELNDLFTSGFKEVDALLTSLSIDEKMDIAKLVLEYKSRKLLVRYATRSDSVPFTFRIGLKKHD